MFTEKLNFIKISALRPRFLLGHPSYFLNVQGEISHVQAKSPSCARTSWAELDACKAFPETGASVEKYTRG